MYMIVEVSQYVAVASFSEAWIEISPSNALWLSRVVASFSEAWIEIIINGGTIAPPRRLLLGGVD